jgi:hypothetical protein
LEEKVRGNDQQIKSKQSIYTSASGKKSKCQRSANRVTTKLKELRTRRRVVSGDSVPKIVDGTAFKSAFRDVSKTSSL